MKRLVLIGFILVLICKNLIGQDNKPYDKGNFIIGGTIALSLEKEKDIKPGISPLPDAIYTTNRKNFETHLDIGYFPLNHLAFGLRNELVFSNSKTSSELTSGTIWDINDKDFLIGPFVRYYIDPGFFFEGYSGLGLTRNVINGAGFKIKNYALSAGLGYCFFLNKNVSIEPIVKYNYMHNKVLETNEDISTLNLSFSIGFQIYLNVEKKVTPNLN